MDDSEWLRLFLNQIEERRYLMTALIKGLVLGSVAGILAGFGSAVFLSGLDWAVKMQNAKPYLIWFLPLAGFLAGLVYHRFGGVSKLGTNLILDEVRNPARKIPARMAPLVLVATLVTHLFGGSAGREGTGIQIAGSLTDTAARVLRFSGFNRRILLNASIAGGFASLAGTPLAGTMFAIEVLQIGGPTYEALFPSLVAAFVGDKVLSTLVTHTHYIPLQVPKLDVGLIIAILVLGIASGVVALVFTQLTHSIKGLHSRYVKYPPLRLAIGGIVIILLTVLVGSRDYNGLGSQIIEAAILGEKIFLGAFLLKILFTAVTVGSGFQGGEMVPLFFIGATLGNALGQIMGVSPSLLAALGFCAVFAGASNTPIACTLMGIEMFGPEFGVYFAATCTVSYIFSGHQGIYRQPVRIPKSELIQVPSDSTQVEPQHVQSNHVDNHVA